MNLPYLGPFDAVPALEAFRYIFQMDWNAVYVHIMDLAEN